MAGFRPKYLNEQQVGEIVDAYLRDLEVNSLREHLRLVAAEHINGSELTHENIASLAAALEEEKRRLVKLAGKKKPAKDDSEDE